MAAAIQKTKEKPGAVSHARFAIRYVPAPYLKGLYVGTGAGGV